jgi:hypothetical protein
MVRQKSRNRGLYMPKMMKATETSSGFSTWNGALSRESCLRQPGSNPTTTGANSESEDAAASKGLDGDLSLSV